MGSVGDNEKRNILVWNLLSPQSLEQGRQLQKSVWNIGDVFKEQKYAGYIYSPRRRFQHRRKKGGEGIGYGGHKHQKGLKELTIADNNGFIVAPIVVRPVNNHDTTLLPEALENLSDMAWLGGIDLSMSYLTLDSGFDSEYNERVIGMYQIEPVIKPNPRGTKNWKKLLAMQENFKQDVYKERYKIERVFAWADTYRKLVIRYETLECTHNGFKYLAYSMINLRVFFRGNVGKH